MAITNKVVKELNNELLKALGTAADLSAALANIAYQENAVELLDERDEFVEVYGKCDFVLREGERLIGTYLEKNSTLVGEDLAKEIYEQFIK